MTTQPHILVIDDEAQILRALRTILTARQFKVSVASSGEEGLTLAAAQKPDLIILDLSLPDMDGVEVCTRLREWSQVPIIILSVREGERDKVFALDKGADDYLTKPFDQRELQVRVKNLIDQRRRLREKFRKDIIIQPGEITVTSLDEQFLQKAVNAVETHIADPDFDTTSFSREVGISRKLLHTKIKALTGMTSGEFIRTLRLKRAAQLFSRGSGNVSEIAYEVGFNNLSYFAKTFKETFGTSPSKFVKS